MAKQVRFKVTSRFRSLEGKSNKQGLRWLGDKVVWCGLVIESIIDWNNPVLVYGLNSPVKYCRILWRNINGRKRWFVQLINNLIKHIPLRFSSWRGFYYFYDPLLIGVTPFGCLAI